MHGYFDNLRVFEETREDGKLVVAPPKDAQIFKLQGDNGQGYIVAGVIVHIEDDEEYDAPSAFMKWEDPPIG